MSLLRWLFKIFCQPWIDVFQAGIITVEDEKGKRWYWVNNNKERDRIIKQIREGKL